MCNIVVGPLGCPTRIAFRSRRSGSSRHFGRQQVTRSIKCYYFGLCERTQQQNVFETESILFLLPNTGRVKTETTNVYWLRRNCIRIALGDRSGTICQRQPASLQVCRWERTRPVRLTTRQVVIIWLKNAKLIRTASKIKRRLTLQYISISKPALPVSLFIYINPGRSIGRSSLRFFLLFLFLFGWHRVGN